MEGQRISAGLRMCSKCRIVKETCEFHKCGAISKKTGERYYSSLCRSCHKIILKEGYRKKKQRQLANRGQQLVLRPSIANLSPGSQGLPLLDMGSDLPILEFPRDADLSDSSLSE